MFIHLMCIKAHTLCSRTLLEGGGGRVLIVFTLNTGTKALFGNFTLLNQSVLIGCIQRPIQPRQVQRGVVQGCGICLITTSSFVLGVGVVPLYFKNIKTAIRFSESYMYISGSWASMNRNNHEYIYLIILTWSLLILLKYVLFAHILKGVTISIMYNASVHLFNIDQVFCARDLNILNF